jgi:hypothetical protein
LNTSEFLVLTFLTKAFRSGGGVTAETKQGFNVPEMLPKLGAKNGQDLLRRGGFQALPSKSDPAMQSPAEFLRTALNERQEVIPTTNALAQSLPEKERLQWAIDSCEMVKDQLPESEQNALVAAKEYFADPSPAKQELARCAADQTDFKGPAGWTAKAASLASLSSQAVPITAAKEVLESPKFRGPDVVGQCVAGAVMLAATLSAIKDKRKEKPAAPPTVAAPAVQAITSSGPAIGSVHKPGSPEAVQMAKSFKPFIERALVLAAG